MTDMDIYNRKEVGNWCVGFMDFALYSKKWQKYADSEALKEIAKPIFNIYSHTCKNSYSDSFDDEEENIGQIKFAIKYINEFFKMND
jgi:hypothetical protein